MILKASQRGGGADLAAHLMRLDDNEHVRLHELRGFASDDLRGAFKEAEAISRGTRCKQYLFSLSLSPPEGQAVLPEAFEAAIEKVEAKLGLTDQPRAVVIHEKEGRRHAHCVWSRIDAEEMKAVPLPFFKNRLVEISRDLYLDHGWKMPKGLSSPLERDPTNFTLAEWQQAKRMGQDPRWLKATLQECWSASDSARAFGSALEERGFFLAQGDRRGFVVLDHTGEVHSLSRALGLKAKEVGARLGKPDALKGVAERQAEIGGRMSPAIRRHVEESKERFRERSAQLGHYKEELTKRHRAERTGLDARQDAEWQEGARGRAARLPRGVRGLWHRITGKYREVRAENEREAKGQRLGHAAERQALIDKQLEQRARLQILFKDLRRRQAEQLLELRKDVGRYLAFSRGADAARERGQQQGRDIGLSLRLEQ